MAIGSANGTTVAANGSWTFPSTITGSISGTAANVTGTVAIANGGTGETTRQAAIDALAGAVTSGQYLRGNGTDVVMSAIQVADVPTLNQNTTGTASNVTGTVAIANGGTGETTRQAAMDALAGAVTSGQYLRGNGTDVVMSAIQVADVPTLNQNTTGSAATLTTGRTIAITGDLAYTSPSFNGSTNVTAAGTLATVNANVGSFTNASITVNGKGLITAASSGTAPVTSVTGTSPVVSSGGATPAISLASGYGDTQNPYASKTANFFLAAPNGTAGVPTFRAIVAADIPTLNQNTTGTASNVTGTVAIANGGTGQTTKVAAFDALSPASTKGDLIAFDGTDNVRLPVGADGLVLQADSTQTTGLKWAAAGSSGATISNDTTTATNVYPTFVATTSGTLSTINTSNAKLLYKPSTGELTSEHFIAGNGIFVNNLTIDVSYTIAAGTSGMSAGPVTVASGTTVTVASGSRWVVM
jgi:molybdopterin biosynthesis enzyme MoaB